MTEMYGYKIDKVGEPNCEGWKLSKTYNPDKDQSVNKDKFYVLQDPCEPNGNRYVSKELGYIGEDGSFHYYSTYQKH